jgi:hypothetical protein
MPLTLPDLDDRAYADLVAEARSLIPAFAPDWTDHNPADPGITLIELFAWLIEMLLYRVNQVTDANRLAFLRLINGPDWKPANSVDEEVRKTVLALRRPARAVTAADFERIALAVPDVARAYCVPRRNLEEPERKLTEPPPDVSVVIVPKRNVRDQEGLSKAVRHALEDKRLLTTWLHVVPARPVRIRVQLTVMTVLRQDQVSWSRRWATDASDWDVALTLTVRARDDMPGALLLERAEDALVKFLDPHTGGPAGRGWPFGRSVYLSDIYDRLAGLQGADYVTPTEKFPELAAREDEPPRLLKINGGLLGLALDPDELPAAIIPEAGITVTVKN